MNDITVFAAPLPFSNKQTKTLAAPGSSLEDIFRLVTPAHLSDATIDARMEINGWLIPRENWHLVRPKPGTLVNVRIVPQGGGGGKKSPLVTILSIAVMIAAPYVGGFLTAALGNAGFWLGSTYFTSAFVYGTAFSAVSHLLISALAPPPKPSNAGVGGAVTNPTISPTQFIEGATNQINVYGVVPICLGTNRMVPPQAARPYTESQDNDQYVRQIFTYGYGESLAVSDFKIGETDISEFTEVEMAHCLEGNLHEGTSLYTNDTHQENYSIRLLQVDGYTTRTTQPDTNEAIVDVTFPRGIIAFATDTGKQHYVSVDLEIQYSPVGAGTWSSSIPINLVMSTSQAVRVSERIVFPSAGQYDIRIQRVTEDVSKANYTDDTYFTALKSVRYSSPVTLEGINGTAVRIKATDQLNGTIDQFNAIVSNIILDFNDGGSGWEERATSNPASLYRYVLQCRANARALSDDKIDIAGFEDWHEHCTAQGYTYNRVIDYETSIDEVLKDIAAAGAASPTIVDGKRSIVIDRIKDDIVQIITPRNSWGYTGQMTFPVIPHAFRVQFRNADKGYQQDERIVYDDGYDETNATIFETLELQSCTSSDLAFKTARRHIASIRLRPETHTVMMDVENLVALRGNRVKLEHDAPLIGIGDGRIKTVETDGGSPEFVTAFTVDDTIGIPDDGLYYVRIRRTDGVQLYKELVTVPGHTSSFEFATPFSVDDAPAAGDLCYFVEAGEEVDAIITRIEPQEDLTARITLINYAPEIFTSESSEIPPFNSHLSTPLEFIRPLPPVLLTAQSDETVMLRNSDGTFISRAIFTLENPNDNDVDPSITFRPSGTSFFVPANTLDATPERVILTGMQDNSYYDILIRYRRKGSTTYSLPLQINGYLFVGAGGKPDDVSDFTVDITGDIALFKWTANDDIDLRGYRMKYSSLFSGATWSTAQLLEDIIYENRLSTPFRPGTYLIKAVDLSGNESDIATAVITFDPGTLPNVVEELVEDPDFTGAMDNVVLDPGNGITLDDVTLGEGYYDFSDIIDLGGVYSATLSSSLTVGGAYIGSAGSDDIFAETDVFTMTDIFGIGQDGWEIELQYSTTQDDPGGSPVTWSDWTKFATGSQLFWGVRFRIYLKSLQQFISPHITAASVTVDMPDRIERGNDLSVGTGGITIDYSPQFKSNPAVAITLQDGATDDKIEYISKDSTGFTFKVYNETAAGYVARTFDYIASGYGRINA